MGHFSILRSNHNLLYLPSSRQMPDSRASETHDLMSALYSRMGGSKPMSTHRVLRRTGTFRTYWFSSSTLLLTGGRRRYRLCVIHKRVFGVIASSKPRRSLGSRGASFTTATSISADVISPEVTKKTWHPPNFVYYKFS